MASVDRLWSDPTPTQQPWLTSALFAVRYAITDSKCQFAYFAPETNVPGDSIASTRRAQSNPVAQRGNKNTQVSKHGLPVDTASAHPTYTCK